MAESYQIWLDYRRGLISLEQAKAEIKDLYWYRKQAKKCILRPIYEQSKRPTQSTSP